MYQKYQELLSKVTLTYHDSIRTYQLKYDHSMSIKIKFRPSKTLSYILKTLKLLRITVVITRKNAYHHFQYRFIKYEQREPRHCYRDVLSHADPVLPGLGVYNDHTRSHCTVQDYSNISINATDLVGSTDIFKSTPLPWLKVFKYLYQSYCTGWRHLNVKIRSDVMIQFTYRQTDTTFYN